MVEIEDIARLLSLAFLLMIGLGVGASTTSDDFRRAFAKPQAVGIGFGSQYLLMPITAYLLTVIFQLKKEHAIGVVLIGCSPGGTTSNLFTYWSHGNVALSVTMSFLSTVAAFALMPFWIWVLITKAMGQGSGTKIDWTGLIVSLLVLILPICFGLAIREYNTKAKIGKKLIWEWLELSATLLGTLFLIIGIVIAIAAYGNILKDANFKIWIICLLMQPLGCAFGYIAAYMSRMSPKDICTISLETGVQNFALPVAIIQFSFSNDNDLRRQILAFPVCFGLLYLVWSPLIVLFFRNCVTSQNDNINSKEIDNGDNGIEKSAGHTSIPEKDFINDQTKETEDV
jgi:sodium/bile acid cotransporter 2